MVDVGNKLLKKPLEVKNICCIGAGYVGGPTMAVIAKHCPDIQVNVVDINENRINLWNEKNLNNLPVFEPGLDLIINQVRNKNLHFSTKVKESVINADLIFLAVNTPTKSKGIGAGQASDLRWIEACAREISEYAKGHTIVVEKSTLPVRTAEVIEQILNMNSNLDDKNVKKSFSILSNPEFLSEGTAIDDLENPDRVLIGGDDKNAIKTLFDIYSKWVDQEKIICTNIWSSELSKLTANAFLAQRISSINAISALCEKTGADINEVTNALGKDKRIGEKFLKSGPGFGGSCFKKDILNLVYLCNYFNLPEAAEYWMEVINLNHWQQKRISKLIIQKLFGTISEKKIAILGFSFKENTNDTRESPSIQICKDLLDEGAKLAIHDPRVCAKNIEYELGIKCRKINEINTKIDENKILQEVCFYWSENIDQIVYGADAIVILTGWDDYKKLDFDLLNKNMRKPAWVFDCRDVLNNCELYADNINFWRVGKG